MKVSDSSSNMSILVLIKRCIRSFRILEKPIAAYDALRRRQLIKKKKSFIQKQGLLYLEKITSNLTNNGIIAFADFGTLLGLVRENALLAHDTDIDIGLVLINAIEIEVVAGTMRNFGFQEKYSYFVNGKKVQSSYILGLLKVDLCFYSVEDESMICYLFYRKDNEAYSEDEMNVVIKKCATVRETIKENFNGFDIDIPTNSREVLEDKYGENWRVPDEGWAYWQGPNTEECSAMGKVIVY